MNIRLFVCVILLGLQLGCATDPKSASVAPIKSTSVAPMSAEKLDIPTPRSVCVDRAGESYSQCLSRGVFAQDTCSAFYQQAVDICYQKYKQ